MGCCTLTGSDDVAKLWVCRILNTWRSQGIAGQSTLGVSLCWGFIRKDDTRLIWIHQQPSRMNCNSSSFVIPWRWEVSQWNTKTLVPLPTSALASAACLAASLMLWVYEAERDESNSSWAAIKCGFSLMGHKHWPKSIDMNNSIVREANILKLVLDHPQSQGEPCEHP